MSVKLRAWLPLLLLILIGTLVSMVTVGIFHWSSYQWHGITRGTVLKVSDDVPRVATIHYVIEGRNYEMKEAPGPKRSVRKGDQVNVRYQIDSPKIASMTGYSSPWTGVIVTGLTTALLFLLFAWICFIDVSERSV